MGWINQKGNRKMVVVMGLTLISLTIATAFVLIDKMPTSEWVDLAKWLCGGGATSFVVGNAAEHIALRKASPKKKK